MSWPPTAATCKPHSPYVEVWLEKDALSGIVEDVMRHMASHSAWAAAMTAGAASTGSRALPTVADGRQAGESALPGRLQSQRRGRAAQFARATAGARRHPDIRKIALTREQIDAYDCRPIHEDDG